MQRTSWVLGGLVVVAVLLAGINAENRARATVDDAVTEERPFFYVDAYYDGAGPASLRMVDRETGEDTLVYQSDEWNILSLVAAPELVYDGRVFLHAAVGDSDNPTYNLKAYDVTTRELTDVDWEGELPKIDATLVSLDEEKIVAVYDNPGMGDTSREIVVWNFLTGEKVVLGQLTGDEHFASVFGDNVFAGAYGYSLRWVNLSCVRAGVYENVISEEDGVTELSLKEYRNYCLTE